MQNIRNFSIIAHIDHGKSTLADRLIETCEGMPTHSINQQILDSLELERERGITIQAQNITLQHTTKNGKKYQLNLIDTPGHIDFSYEVSRSLAACEGALLVVDSCQGVEAQTLNTCYAAVDMGLEILVVLNKVDLPLSNPRRVSQEIEDIIGIDTTNAICCSAKTGFGISNVLEKILYYIPPPNGNSHAPLQALIIHSWFDKYLGVISLIRIKHGILNINDKIKIINTGAKFTVCALGICVPHRKNTKKLQTGEIGWIMCNIKNILSAPVGDTITLQNYECDTPLPGFKKKQTQVYASLFPLNSNDYHKFKTSLGKLSLSDAALSYQVTNSAALGTGCRCGFLGMLHMEIVQERLKREYNLNLITTPPSVMYQVQCTDGTILYVDSPSKLLTINNIHEIREPIASCHILTPLQYFSKIVVLCTEKRGIQIDIIYHTYQIEIHYNIPMNEIILDFFNRIQSISHGYASLHYHFQHFLKSQIVCLEIKINKHTIDPLSIIMHKKKAQNHATTLIKKIQKTLPRHMFDITVQAVIKNHVIASIKINQLRKNVIAKCYGGDVTRKKKLLQKQKTGKKRMKTIGSVCVSPKTFLSILQLNNK